MKGLRLVEVEQWLCPLCFFFFFHFSLTTDLEFRGSPSSTFLLYLGASALADALAWKVYYFLLRSNSARSLPLPTLALEYIYIYMAWHLIVQRYSHFRR